MAIYKVQRLYSKQGKAIKALRKSKKEAKKAWENAGADAVLVGPKTVGQFRKINASGTTLTKHELKGGIGVAIKDGEGHIHLRPSSVTNHSVNAKGIEEALHPDIFKDDHMSLAKRLHNDPLKGTDTHIRWKL